jgi:serine/threonine protein kinase
VAQSPPALSTAAPGTVSLLSIFFFGLILFLFVDAQVIVINQHTFKIIKELGKGGFGIVFEAIDVDTGGVVED